MIQSCAVRRSVGVPTSLPSLRRHRVHEDLAEARRDRAQRRLESAAAAASALQHAFGDELAREIDVRAVLEHDRDLRQAVARQRARVLQPRQAAIAVSIGNVMRCSASSGE